MKERERERVVPSLLHNGLMGTANESMEFTGVPKSNN